MTAAKTARNPPSRPELSIGGINRKPAEPVSVDASKARITRCAPFVDRRFTPDAGYVGEFAKAGIGRYVDEAAP